MQKKKELVEDKRYISINDVKDMEVGTLYICSWSNDMSINVKAQRGYFELLYRYKSKKMEIVVEVESTRVGYGYRPWFKCPTCSRRTAKLYFNRGYFACRDCHDLTYIKSRLSGNEFEYITWRIRELQAELQVSKENSYPYLGLTDTDIEWVPLFKPKHMRWETFVMKKQLLEFLIIKRTELWMAKVK